jgi:photosystem II stability/assembly factor-like uncharacterized protein
MLKWEKLSGSDAAVYAFTREEQGEWLVGTHDGLWRIDRNTLTRVGLAGVPVTALAASKRGWFVGAPDGLARSTDRGATWSMVAADAAQVSQIALTPYFDTTGMGYAATLTNGMMRTFDHGASWGTCNNGIGVHSTYAVHLSETFADDHALIIANDAGLHVSNNVGSVWLEMQAYPKEALPVVSFAYGESCVWVNSEEAGVFRLKNSGLDFDRPDFLPPDTHMIASDPVDKHLVALTSDGDMHLSIDHGAHWRAIGSPEVSAISAVSLDRRQVLCGDQAGGIWRARFASAE